MGVTGKRKKKGKNPYPSNKKRKLKKAEEKNRRRAYWIVVSFATLYLLQDSLLEAKTIGSDSRYLLYIVFLPIILGIIGLAIYRRKQLVEKLAKTTSPLIIVFRTLNYLIQAILIAYFTIGLLAKSIWNELNIREAAQNDSELFNCDAKYFTINSDGDAKVYFYFQFDTEYVYSDKEFLKPYLNKNVEDYFIEVKAKKGLWGYHILKDWTIIERD